MPAFPHISLDAGETWTTAWDSDVETVNLPADSHVHGCCYDPWEDAFYVIERGQADVVQGGDRIGHLGAGSYFGELGLLTGQFAIAYALFVFPRRDLAAPA